MECPHRYGTVRLPDYQHLAALYPELFGAGCDGITEDMILNDEWEQVLLEGVLFPRLPPERQRALRMLLLANEHALGAPRRSTPEG